ncbi:MAG: hypothetical protein NT076_02330 [Candidatus Pacearchaeota archaeon]|nr:hypothetical protein [Candidatus Pacearchaeota archaeon]
MKNKLICVFIIALFLASFIALNLAWAADNDVPGLPSYLQNDPEQTVETYKNKTLTTSEYLKKEWKTILIKKPYIGPTVIFLDNLFTSINPFFKLVLGFEYSLSWAFIFAMIIWIILFIFLYQPAKAVFNSNTLLGILTSFAITSLIGLAGVIKKVIDLLSTMINNQWIFYLSLAITILIGLLIIKLGGNLKEIIKETKEKETKEKEKKDRKILDASAKVEKKNLEEYK